jgi:hypothetical protein
MNRPARPVLFPLTLLILSLLPTLTGCAGRAESRSFEIQAGTYDDAIIATRDTLRASGYTLERIDATAGEITTTERTVAGLASPFASENRNVSGLVADTLTNRPRTVRVRFRDATNPASPPNPDAPVRAEVDAMIWKRVRPGWRVETETMVGNAISRDRAEQRRGVSSGEPVPVGRDDDFARVIARRIQQRLADRIASDRPDADPTSNP